MSAAIQGVYLDQSLRTALLRKGQVLQGGSKAVPVLPLGMQRADRQVECSRTGPTEIGSET